jgi:hypothetical protein
MVSFSEAKSIIESVAELIKKSATIDLQEKIMSLREFIVSIKDENIALKEENQALKLEISTEKEFHLKNGLYWKEDDEVPFCQKCLDGSKKRIHLQKRDSGGWKCFECTNYYGAQTVHIFRPNNNRNNSAR